MSSLTRWSQARTIHQQSQQQSLLREHRRSAKRLRRKVLKALDQGVPEFSYNGWMTDGRLLPQEAIEACEDSLPRGVKIRQREVPCGSWESDLLISIELP